MLLFAMGCHDDPGKDGNVDWDGDPDSPADTDPGMDSGDPTDPASTIVDAEVGGRVYGASANGAWAQDADGELRWLYEGPTYGVNAAGSLLTTWDQEAIRVYDLDGGELTATIAVDCGADSWIADALHVGGFLRLACGSYHGGGPVYDVADEGTRTESGRWATTLQSDQGILYLGVDLDREGTSLTPVHPVTLEDVGETAYLSYNARARGGGASSCWGDASHASKGGISLHRWDETAPETSPVLADGEFPLQLDSAGPDLLFVSLLAVDTGETGDGVLMRADGTHLATVPACGSPQLLYREDALEGWCTGPLRRITWELVDGAWRTTSEETFDLPATTVRVLEPSD